MEGDRENLLYGPPRNRQELTDRVIAALAEKAAATASNVNDRLVLVDLGQTPAVPTAGPAPAPAPSPAPERPACAGPPGHRRPSANPGRSALR